MLPSVAKHAIASVGCTTQLRAKHHVAQALPGKKRFKQQYLNLFAFKRIRAIKASKPMLVEGKARAAIKVSRI